MHRTDVIVIGAGQAGLAASFCLAELGIDHVVFERGRVGQRWRSERWDSLRLLTPSWQSRLPGWRYTGPNPDGYMTMPEVIDYLSGYAAYLPVPVQEHTSVRSVSWSEPGYYVETDRGDWLARNVIVATGACDTPKIPSMARELYPSIFQTTPTRYRRPSDMPEGGVLVVGASASGLQLADELSRSGRPVTLAVGKHTRLPRTYRGRDIMWWLDMIGTLGESTDGIRDRVANQPSLQLVGTPERSNLDLPTLAARGVKLVGRAIGATGSRVRFDSDLEARVAKADRKLARLVDRIESFAGRSGLDAALPEPEPMTGADLRADATEIDLVRENIRSIVWATGFRRSYSWLNVPVFDADGEIRQRGGVSDVPGLYALGLKMMRTRRSTFIDGVGADARAIANHIASQFDVRALAA